LALVALSGFWLPRKLGERDDRHVKLFGQELQAARNLRNLLRPIVEPSVPRHQLKIVDDEKIESRLAFQSLRLSAHRRNAEQTAVVDEELRSGDLRLSQNEAADRLLGSKAVSNFFRVHIRLGAEDAEAKLLFRHFEREKAHRFGLTQGDVLREIQRERRLSDGRPGRQDDQIGGLQARGHTVELRKTRREAREHALAVARVLDDLQVVLDHLADRREGLADRVVRDREDFAGDVTQQLLGAFGLGKPLLHRPPPEEDEPTQYRLLLDDAGGVLHIGYILNGVHEPPHVSAPD